MKKIRLTYIGRRTQVFGRKTYQTFLNGKDEIPWSGLRGLVIGHDYEAEKKGGKLSMLKRPPSVGEAIGVSAARITAWEALDQKVQDEADETRALNRLRGNKNVKRFASELVPIIEGMNVIEIHAIVRVLVHEASRQSKRRRS